MRLGEEVGDRLGDHRTDALDGAKLLRRVRSAGGGAQRLPIAEMTREPARVGLADMADAEREQEAVQRDRAPRVDGGEEVARRSFAKAFPFAQRRRALAVARAEA